MGGGEPFIFVQAQLQEQERLSREATFAEHPSNARELRGLRKLYENLHYTAGAEAWAVHVRREFSGFAKVVERIPKYLQLAVAKLHGERWLPKMRFHRH